MIGVLNESGIVKEYEFIKPLFHKIDSIIGNCIRDCNNNYFQTLDHKCAYDLQLTRIGNNETVKITISDKSTELYELNKNSTVARKKGLILTQINILTVKIYSNLSNVNTHYYPKIPIPIMHRQFFKLISQNLHYVQSHCDDRKTSFGFACRK